MAFSLFALERGREVGVMWGGGGWGFFVVVWGYFSFTLIKSKSRPNMNANAGDCCMNSSRM